MPSRKPSHLHELSGAWKKNPQRRRTNEPQPTAGIGPCPAHCDEAVRDAWDELVDQIAPGVLTCQDRLPLEILATLLIEFRTKGADMSAARFNGMRVLCGQFGLSPSERGRVEVPDQHAANPFGRI